MSDEHTIERARPKDRDAILEVMRPWNMHHVPSPEMEELDTSCFFVARHDGRVVGAAGWAVVSQKRGKTTLLGVLPEHSGRGLGRALQEARLEAMAALGVRTVTTNADRPRTITWYRDVFGYREVGRLPKVAEFGDPDVPEWTTLEPDLEAWQRGRDAEARQRELLDRYEAHPLAPYPPLLVNVALTGMIPTKRLTPHVPVSPDEIIADAIRVAEAGAQIVHVHARDEEGQPTWRAEAYERILAPIRRECPELVLCVTTSGRNWSDFERRSEVLDLDGDARPDMASLTLGSMNFVTGPSVNAPTMIQQLAGAMKERGIRPELEVFDLGMVHYARYLERKGLLPRRKYVNILLGSLGTAQARIGALAALVDALPDETVWAAAGIGVFQLPMNVAAIVAGGGVRVGIEDSIHFDFGRTELATNEAVVQRIVRIAEECQRPLATPIEARRVLGLDGSW